MKTFLYYAAVMKTALPLTLMAVNMLPATPFLDKPYIPSGGVRHLDSIKTKMYGQQQNLDMYHVIRNKKNAPKNRINTVNIKNGYLVTKYDRVNIRKQPNMSAEIVCNLRQDTKLIFLERHVSWYKVKVPRTGQVGFIHQYMVK